jgi:YHS domain-containing protein
MARLLFAPFVLVLPLLLACGAAPDAPAGEAWAKVPLADGAISAANAASEVPAAFRNGAGEVACPVMGMAIKSGEDAVSYADHEGTRYYFCCDSCEKLFLDDPKAYANGAYLKSHDLDPTAPAACEDAEKIEG